MPKYITDGSCCCGGDGVDCECCEGNALPFIGITFSFFSNPECDCLSNIEFELERVNEDTAFNCQYSLDHFEVDCGGVDIFGFIGSLSAVTKKYGSYPFYSCYWLVALDGTFDTSSGDMYVSTRWAAEISADGDECDLEVEGVWVQNFLSNPCNFNDSTVTVRPYS